VSGRRHVFAVLLASFAFAAALAGRGSLSVWLGTGAAAVASIAGAAWVAGDRLRELLRPRFAAVAAGVASGALLAAASHLGYRLAVVVAPALRPLVAALYDELRASPGQLVSVPILAFVIVAEEVIWRGLAVDALAAARLGPFAQVGGATLLYVAPLAASGSLVLVLVGAGCGAVWSTLRVATGGLVAPIVSHLVWAVAVLVVWPLPVV
jgi:membrane protease YdiL (CAAX protease family)